MKVVPPAVRAAPGAALRRVVSALRIVLAAERRAIGTLDMVTLQTLELDKEVLAVELRAELDGALPHDPFERTALLTEVRRVRAELRANGLLIQAAVEAIRAVLGFEEASGYDRRARQAPSAAAPRLLGVL